MQRREVAYSGNRSQFGVMACRVGGKELWERRLAIGQSMKSWFCSIKELQDNSVGDEDK